MIDIFTYKIIYFIITLILGFLIGYMIKKGSYQKRIEVEVENKEKEFNTSSQNLREVNKQFIESENRFKINTDLISTQKDLIKKVEDEMVAIKQKIINLEEAKVELTTKLDESQIDLEKYKNKISSLKPQYEDAENIISENKSLSYERDNLSDKLDISNHDIINIQTSIKKDDDLYKKYQNELLEKDDAIKKLNIKYTNLQDKKQITSDISSNNIENSLKELKIKVLNYKYEISDIKNKISNGIDITDEHIDKFIAKNEQERFIDKILPNIFNTKSKKVK